MTRRGYARLTGTVLVAVAVVAVALGAWQLAVRTSAGPEPTPTTAPGGATAGISSLEYAPPEPVSDFTLTAHSGEPFTLSDYRGQVVVLYFGYTFCPDVCPLTLSNYKQALSRLPEDLRDDVQVVMVTVDPERDTAGVLERYMANFDPSYIGVTGTPAEVAAVLRDWRIPVEKEAVAPGEPYFVGHPAYSLVLDRDGLKRLKVSHLVSVADIAADLQRILEVE